MCYRPEPSTGGREREREGEREGGREREREGLEGGSGLGYEDRCACVCAEKQGPERRKEGKRQGGKEGRREGGKEAKREGWKGRRTGF